MAYFYLAIAICQFYGPALFDVEGSTLFHCFSENVKYQEEREKDKGMKHVLKEEREKKLIKERERRGKTTAWVVFSRLSLVLDI